MSVVTYKSNTFPPSSLIFKVSVTLIVYYLMFINILQIWQLVSCHLCLEAYGGPLKIYQIQLGKYKL